METHDADSPSSEEALGSWVWPATGAVYALLLLTFGVAYQRTHRYG